MKIVSGPSSPALSVNISRLLNAPIARIKYKRFPDGEFYFKFEEDISDEDIIVIQSLYPPQESHIFELLVILHTARDLGANNIHLFIPYLAYSRQDERYLSGEAVTSRMLADIIQQFDITSFYTIDIHNKKILSFYKAPAYTLFASLELVNYALKHGINDPIIIAPDDEEDAIERVKYAASNLSLEYNFLGKFRDRYTGEITTIEREFEVKERDVVLIDDIISTGKTMANAVRILRRREAGKIYVGVSHLLPSPHAIQLIYEAGADEIFASDTIPSELSKVSVAPIFVQSFKKNI